MALGDLADSILRGIEDAGAGVQSALFEPVIRLGVTGFSGAGKTVFITGLVANLLRRGRMGGLSAEAEGRIEAAFLQPQPDDTVPRFPFEDHLAALSGPEPRWPQSTRSVSQLRLSLRVRPGGLLSGLRGVRVVHLDIVDYPGEWLLDLALLDQGYAEWSDMVLDRATGAPRADHASAFLAQLDRCDPAAPLDEADAQALALAFAAYQRALAADGLTPDGPGRFILPGELDRSPALTFAPLPRPKVTRRGTLWREMERRFNAYKTRVAKPFFRDHFARIDRQVVLVDTLGALHRGPRAVAELGQSMEGVLRAFRPGRNGWLSGILGKRVERILFAATKADHLHHGQHDRLAAITGELLAAARSRASFSGAATQAMALSAWRATVEEDRRHDGRTLGMVRGRLEDGRQAAFHAGTLPDDPASVLGPARDGADGWLDGDYAAMRFLPMPVRMSATDGPPHIRLDRAAEFLIGDRL